MKLSSFD